MCVGDSGVYSICESVKKSLGETKILREETCGKDTTSFEGMFNGEMKKHLRLYKPFMRREEHTLRQPIRSLQRTQIWGATDGT